MPTVSRRPSMALFGDFWLGPLYLPVLKYSGSGGGNEDGLGGKSNVGHGIKNRVLG